MWRTRIVWCDPRYKELLASHECPFSFYERDKEAAAAKTARRAAAKDPNRFQVSALHSLPVAKLRLSAGDAGICTGAGSWGTSTGFPATSLAVSSSYTTMTERARAAVRNTYNTMQHIVWTETCLRPYPSKPLLCKVCGCSKFLSSI